MQLVFNTTATENVYKVPQPKHGANNFVHQPLHQDLVLSQHWMESLLTLPSYSIYNPLTNRSALPYSQNWPELVSSLPLLFWYKTAQPPAQTTATSTKWSPCALASQGCPLYLGARSLHPGSKGISQTGLPGILLQQNFPFCQLWFSYFYLFHLPGPGYLFSFVIFIVLFNTSFRKTAHFASIPPWNSVIARHSLKNLSVIFTHTADFMNVFWLHICLCTVSVRHVP